MRRDRFPTYVSVDGDAGLTRIVISDDAATAMGRFFADGRTTAAMYRVDGLSDDDRPPEGTILTSALFEVDQAIGAPLEDVVALYSDMSLQDVPQLELDHGLRVMCDGVSYHAWRGGLISSRQFLSSSRVEYESLGAYSAIVGAVGLDSGTTRAPHRMAALIQRCAATGTLVVLDE